MSDAVATATDPALLAALDELEVTPRTVVLHGHTLTLRSPCPQGALSVFAIRLVDKTPIVQATAVMRLLRAWTVPECHDDVDAMMEEVLDLEDFQENHLPAFVEAALARPTSAPSSSLPG